MMKKMMTMKKSSVVEFVVTIWLLQTLVAQGNWVQRPLADVQYLSSSSSLSFSVTKPEPVDLGTTLVAVCYDSGVVVAADSRTSVGGFVSNRYAHKLASITSHCTILRSGSAADTQAMAQACRHYFSERRLRYCTTTDRPPTVAQIAHWMRAALLQMMMNQGGGEGPQVSLLVAGWDDNNDTSQQPSIYSVALSGALLKEQDFAASGSGSVFILGFLDHEIRRLCRRKNKKRTQNNNHGEDDFTNDNDLPEEQQEQQHRRQLTQDEAIQLCQRAIALAASRDGSSGGIIRMRIIDRQGTRELATLPATMEDVMIDA